MTYQEAYQKLEKAGQLHVLAHYESLTEAQQKSLLKEIGLTDFSVLSYLEKREELMKKGEITPLAAMEISEIERSHVWYEELAIARSDRGRSERCCWRAVWGRGSARMSRRVCTISD